MGVPTVEELQTALAEAVRMREQGEDPHHIAKALLNQHYQLEKLEKVMHAAELYFRSGNAEQEHTKLVRAIEAAKSSRSDTADRDELDYGL